MLKEKVYPWRDRLEPNKRQLVEWTPPGSRVIEFGCATGYMSRVLREYRGCTVTGFEYSPAAAAQAAAYCERIVVGDIEDERLWEGLDGPYDVAVFADVLEHLRDPDRVLQRTRTWLSPGGRVLVSIPNIAHHSIRWQLLHGHFDYTESGLLDETHLRFFTRTTTLAMLGRCGYRAEELGFSVQRTRLDWILLRLRLGAIERALTRIACAIAPDAMAFQWLMRASPASPGVEAGPPRLRGPVLES